jgi:hypothetical protein
VSRFNYMDLGLEARGGIEPPIKVLQTFALPLGDRATGGRKLSVVSYQYLVIKAY